MLRLPVHNSCPAQRGPSLNQPRVADAEGRRRGRAVQRLLRLTSGLLVYFVALGFTSWFSGAASWVGFYLGTRGKILVGLAQVTTGVGFALAVVTTLAWYSRRCRRGETEIPPWAALAACV